MTVKYYGMFTDEGNALIMGVVETAKRADLDWNQVMDLLYDLGTIEGFEEATDTDVRESVYMELNNGQ
jgi:hypothetical protein